MSSNIKKYNTSNKQRKDCCSPGIVNSCKTKCKLHKIFVSDHTNLHKQNYVIFRNILFEIIRIAKRKYYLNLFNRSNIKLTLSCICSIMKHNKINCLPSQLIVDNKYINNLETICEYFNSYFIDTGRNLTKYINCLKTINICRFLPRYFSIFSPTNQYEAQKIITNLRTSSPGNDNIHQKMVKYVATFIDMPLSHIINWTL